MPIDPSVAIGAELPPHEFEWTASDVLLYHLALGAGGDPLDPRELRYATEDDLQVLPTFAVVAPTITVFTPPRVTYPGIEIDLAKVLHGSQRIDVHAPLPTDGKARAVTRVRDVWDKGSSAVVVTETEVRDLDGHPLWTNTSSIFARGEGGFGGERGPSGPPPPPDRAPVAELVTRTLPQQALWYRLCGDRNPLHSSPAFAAAAGFPRPILHGLCTYGLVAKAVVDDLLDGDAARLTGFEVRFAGVVFPGETLRTRVWREGEHFVLTTTVDERDGAPALSGAEVVTR
ncbi:MAG: MaoC/PaaZ C-terminal domain-containing protein [Jatrophihabitans sp.]|uniref:MaoC/PaaZ C-terminal domain-containing protein n=1 Tax=Jatrophihabitans sp. TaxID=1932789 RepID=UPI003F7F905B